MRVAAGELQINAEVRGETHDGTPVVFLHGIGGNGSNWRPQLDALSARHRVVAIDSRGFGASEAKGEDLALEDYADDVRRTLDALEIDQAHVVGLSMGGMMAQALALNAPEKVASLVLADTSARADELMATNLKASGEAALQHGMSVVADIFMSATFCPAAVEDNRDYVQTFRDGFCATDPQAFNTGLQAIAGLDFLDRLSRVAVPTLVVVGSGDMLTPVEHSEAIAARITDARLVVLDGAGHMSNLDNADEFTQVMTEFLEAR
jgi:3-oxoadipate enol-lactonase